MSGEPKPLTKAEWEAFVMGLTDEQEPEAMRIVALVDALFAYRERTRGMCTVGMGTSGPSISNEADDIAADLGLE